MAYASQRTIPVENSRSSALRVIVEPWAFEIVLSPQESCDITIAGPPGEVSLDVGEDWIANWGWEGSCAWATKNGVVVEDYRAHLVPPGLVAMKRILKKYSPPYLA
jgi:hypothetical protein